VAAEVTVRQNIHRTAEGKRFPGGTHADLKMDVFRARGDCPQVVTLGSSVSDRSLRSDFIEGKSLGAGQTIRAPFNFAFPSQRATNMLPLWRFIQNSGCVPRYLLVELSPMVLNGAKGGTPHDRALLDGSLLLSLPFGLAEARGYSLREIAELLTLERLVLQRRRKELSGLLFGATPEVATTSQGSDGRLAKKERAKKPKLLGRRLRRDGSMGSVPNARLDRPGAVKAERKKRDKNLLNGVSVHETSNLELAALRLLVQEAHAAGSIVVLHTPPVTQIYIDMLKGIDELNKWCEVVKAWSIPEGVPWLYQFDSDEYTNSDFDDWDHLNRQGSKRYAERLTNAIRTGQFPKLKGCP
jgi:hypothetical protein